MVSGTAWPSYFSVTVKAVFGGKVTNIEPSSKPSSDSKFLDSIWPSEVRTATSAEKWMSIGTLISVPCGMFTATPVIGVGMPIGTETSSVVRASIAVVKVIP